MKIDALLLCNAAMMSSHIFLTLMVGFLFDSPFHEFFKCCSPSCFMLLFVLECVQFCVPFSIITNVIWKFAMLCSDFYTLSNYIQHVLFFSQLIVRLVALLPLSLLSQIFGITSCCIS